MKSLLILNSGSSSLKFSIFRLKDGLQSIFSGNLSGIGAAPAGRFKLKSKLDQDKNIDRAFKISDHDDAVSILMEWLDESLEEPIDAVGHRIVHGGSRFVKPQLIDDKLVEELKQLSCFAPLHLPPAITTLVAARKVFAEQSHVACFDTSFHRSMPMQARMLPITRELFCEDGVEKFGFHGLSYEFVSKEFHEKFELRHPEPKLIIAHLGNGCSMAAIKGGMSVDTTMGYSPAGGLVMGTRCGDIDPGIVTFFDSEKGLSAKEFVELANNKSGLLGLSGISSDMQMLLALEESQNEDATRAVAIFCYHARKHIGALAAALEGLDALVFTGGIGENSSVIRRRISSGLEFLGVTVKEDLNALSGNRTISEPGSRVVVAVVATNEELMIAQHCRDLLKL